MVTAAAITVSTIADELNNDGDCSLREAITAANTDTAADACLPGSGADTNRHANPAFPTPTTMPIISKISIVAYAYQTATSITGVWDSGTLAPG